MLKGKADFVLGDVRKLSSLPEIQAKSADIAVFMLSIQDMDPLDEVLAAAAWALKADGRVSSSLCCTRRFRYRGRAAGVSIRGAN